MKLTVVRLLLEASEDCSKDRLDIYGGWTVDGGVHLASLCGTELPAQPYVTDTNMAVIRFTSDATVMNAGFLVEYQPQVPGTARSDSTTDNSQSKFARDHHCLSVYLPVSHERRRPIYHTGRLFN